MKRICGFDGKRNISKLEFIVLRKDKVNWGGLFTKPLSHNPIFFDPPNRFHACCVSKRKRVCLIKLEPFDLVFSPQNKDKQKDIWRIIFTKSFFDALFFGRKRIFWNKERLLSRKSITLSLLPLLQCPLEGAICMCVSTWCRRAESWLKTMERFL